ncbi:hypothetical protein PROFUN_02780 [Planoprotostelium fungivorum]|uniref:Ca3427-like PBP 2 domain-containing protein n=1 Tax=Planoprotostelium fungivorum TaxID=1890364 RepID=A0A2P6NXJ8_9EUKA|nr:hypothetical protein PROFUN_02780 [Planoprotostelium fungivorum]
MTIMVTSIKLGYVPEHFSTPIIFADRLGFFREKSLSVELIPFPSGTGHMIEALSNGTVDVAIGLTEGWLAGLGQGKTHYKVVGTYVQSPLLWAVSAGASSDVKEIGDLKDKANIGISRLGSGSHIMSYVLAKENQWLSHGEPFSFHPVGTFQNLRNAVNDGTCHAFMWEYFTTKKYYDLGEIKQVGQIYTPWPSWLVVARADISKQHETMSNLLSSLDRGDEAVSYISTELDYTKEDAEKWLKTVRFSDKLGDVQDEMLKKTLEVLRDAGVVKEIPKVDALVERIQYE